MPSTFQLEIATAERTVFSGSVVSLVLPAHEGYMGVLAGHVPMLVALRPGELDALPTGRQPFCLAVSGGFARVGRDSVQVMTDSAEPAEEIDADRAAAARDRALQRLHSHDSAVDIERARAALMRALNRLRIRSRPRPRT